MGTYRESRKISHFDLQNFNAFSDLVFENFSFRGSAAVDYFSFTLT